MKNIISLFVLLLVSCTTNNKIALQFRGHVSMDSPICKILDIYIQEHPGFNSLTIVCNPEQIDGESSLYLIIPTINSQYDTEYGREAYPALCFKYKGRDVFIQSKIDAFFMDTPSPSDTQYNDSLKRIVEQRQQSELFDYILRNGMVFEMSRLGINKYSILSNDILKYYIEKGHYSNSTISIKSNSEVK